MPCSKLPRSTGSVYLSFDPLTKQASDIRNSGPYLKFIGHAASAQRFQSPYLGSFASELLGRGQWRLTISSTSSGGVRAADIDKRIVASAKHLMCPSWDASDSSKDGSVTDRHQVRSEFFAPIQVAIVLLLALRSS